ncbi:PspC domain-containing protein [Nocardioides sp. JQ2195]|uniref:PspC domain-containing protein n=1 Tax=Nocardioides sp. JQ2195 TaxID=2592334 RepID=UPI00143E14A7|nr:PspC domain-containing protein [Nocardioides sp. JQ2195]QIX25841.1 PspC domain-containing protein [Nocardioides sp. JQ2195]
MNENPTTEGSEPHGPQPQPGAGPTSSTGYADPGAQHGPRVSGEQMRDLASLRRSSYDRHVAGVAGGLGRHLDIDPVILRVAFVVLTFFGGAGLIIYIASWLIVPDDAGNRATISLDDRSRNVALIGVGILAGLALIGDAWGPGWFPWPLFLVGLIAWVFLSRKDRRAGANQGGNWAPYAAPGQGPGWVAGARAGSAPTDPATATPYATTSVEEVAQQPSRNQGSGTFTAPMMTPSPLRPPPPRPLPPLPPRNPRKRGPILFWFTLALIALSLGTLGIFDLAGAGITDSAYPALALGVIAVMLLVGAFYGRAGGLIFLGLVTSVVLAGSTIASQWEGSNIDATPTSASQLKSSYEMEAGEMDIDLTRIRDLDALDGRTLDIDAEVGTVRVIVPRGLHVSVDSTVEIGQITLFGDGTGGLDLDLSRSNSGAAQRPHLQINTDLEVGEVKVITQ